MSLKGKTVLVTRPRDQAASLVREIERRGGRAVVFPAIEITEPDSWSACDEALRRLTAFDAVVFTSTNGVRKFFERLDVLGISRQLPAHMHVVAVGRTTQAELEARGCAVHMIPEAHNTPTLGPPGKVHLAPARTVGGGASR
jgi:uroporphyrinogen-III synthase